MTFREIQALLLGWRCADEATRDRMLKLVPGLKDAIGTGGQVEGREMQTQNDTITITLPRYVWKPILNAVIAHGLYCLRRSRSRPPPAGSTANMDKLYYDSLATASETIGVAIGSEKRLRG